MAHRKRCWPLDRDAERRGAQNEVARAEGKGYRATKDRPRRENLR